MESGDAARFRRLLEAVSRAFLPCAPALPDAFFPAHLPVALINAVFALPPASGSSPPERFAARHYRRFSLERVRADRWNAPAADEQETLSDFLGRDERLGGRAMEDAVFAPRCRGPGTGVSRVRWAAVVAGAFRHIGVDGLQDVHA